MHSTRYSNDVDVQGWEPSLDGGADVSLDAIGLPPTLNYPSARTNTNTTMTTTMRRQAPPTRARAATCPNIHDFSFMPRSGPDSRHGSTMQPTNDGQAPGPSSARNAAAAGRSGSRPRSSTERKIARKLAENANYVPRPKNSFILFRTEFVAQRTNGGSDGSKRSSSATRSHGSSSVKSDDDDEEATSASLSKQASEVWNKMTEEDKRPYVERAKLEKAAHEAKYPNYRYKPVRHNPARKNGPPPVSGRTSQSPFPNPVSGLQRRSSEPMATQAMDGHSNEYQTTVPMSSLHMPAPVPRRLSVSSASPSSSVSRSSTPAVQESQSSTTGSSSGLSLPTVPRVPTLTFNTEAGSSRATVFPPIPRSPSAPIFDRHVVNQFPPPHQQHHLAPPTLGTFQPHHVSGSFADVRRPADPSSPNAASSGLTQITSPVSAGTSDVTMHSSLPTPESSEPNYFRDFVHCDQDDITAGPTPTTASSAFTSPRMFTTSHEIYNDKNNDNGIFDGTHNNTHSHHEIELDQMDIDMRALLNLSPVLEVAESAPAAPTSKNEDVQRPFEAIAALWVQDQQVLAQQQQNLDGSGATEMAPPVQSQVQNFSQPHTQTQTQTQDSPKQFVTMYSSATSKSTGSSVSGSSVATSTDTTDSGLDPFHTHIPNPSTGSSVEDDLFRLDLEFIPPASRFSCATSPSLSGFGSGSGLGLGALDDTLMGLPDSGMGDTFGYDRYDRERGLYGVGPGSPGAPVAGGAGGFGSGFGFGFGLDYGF